MKANQGSMNTLIIVIQCQGNGVLQSLVKYGQCGKELERQCLLNNYQDAIDEEEAGNM